MGALAFIDALSVGSSIELTTQEGVRATATGVAAGPSGGGTQHVAAFTFATASPLNLGAFPASVYDRVAVVITTPFDDPAAAVTLGPGGSPAALLGPADSQLSQAGQYESDALVQTIAPDFLLLTISPGASTQGAGLVFWEVFTP
jgi:hypothetical protein